MIHDQLDDPTDLAEDDTLLRDVERLTGKLCARCDRSLCGHHVVFSIVLGLKTAPHCLPCAARQLKRDVADLREQLTRYVRHRDCYRQAWETVATCQLLRTELGLSCMQDAPDVERNETAIDLPSVEIASGNVATKWDAGDLGCGDLVLGLRNRLMKLPKGGVLELIAHDPAAPEDLPAWCRLTGHRLVSASHPKYLIERKRG